MTETAYAAATAGRGVLFEAVHREAMRGLRTTPKTLNPWLFYDERGSDLFNQITELPEYYLTRLERAIFEEYVNEIVRFTPGPMSFVELGAGSASKTGVLLRAACHLQSQVLYQPIDVSAFALSEAAEVLTAGLPNLQVEPQVANYITENYKVKRPPCHSLLALYIGSSIGNFTPEEAVGILRKLRSHLRKTGDGLLLGVDMAPCCRKSVDTLLAAYDDSAGITAEFNRNVLVRLNREIEAEFPLETFAHRVRWNPDHSRIEMHLESLVAQRITVAGERIPFAAGETIHTENSYKYTERSLRDLLIRAGFGSPHWLYDGDRNFAVAMARCA